MRDLAIHPLTKRILRTGGLFGGVEGMNMFCSLVRNKLIALWIGASGVGVFGFLSTTLDMISSLSQLGLRNSAVQYLSGKYGLEKDTASARVAKIGKWLGVAGGLLTIILSPLLGYLVFDSVGMAWIFCLLAMAVYLSAVVSSKYAIMQSMGRLQAIARASIIATPVALAISLPVIYLQRNPTGIITLILIYWVVLATAVKFNSGYKSVATNESLKETFKYSLPMMRLGFYLTITAFITWLGHFVVMSVLLRCGSESEVGFYQSGYTLTVRYVGIVFTALSMEYFPRMSRAVKAGVRRTSLLMSHQIKVVMWIVVPMAMIMCVLAPWVVKILYSAEFLPVAPLVILAAAGIVMRGVSFCMAYVIIASGRGRVYLFTEVVGVIICVVLNTFGYLHWGMAGVGLSFTFYYAIYCAIVGWTVRYKLGVEIPVWLVGCVALCFAFVAAVSGAILFCC